MTDLGSFVFRLRVRILTDITIGGGEAIINISGLTSPIDVKKVNETAVGQHGAWYTFIGRNFETEEGAQAAGQLLSNTLLLSGALGSLGVDVGFSRTTQGFSESVRNAVSSQSGGLEPRSEIHGLMTYRNGSVVILNFSATASTKTTIQGLQNNIDKWFALSEKLSERQLICASLINDHQYALHNEVRFVLAISAIEAICEARHQNSADKNLVDALILHLNSLDGTTEIKDVLKQTLSRAKKQSIRQACLEKLRTLLGSDVAMEFDKLYLLRSAFLHDGKHRGDLQEAASKAMSIAVQILEADLLQNS